LREKRGADLEQHYNTTLRELAKQKGILGQIFVKSQNKIQDPAKLYRLIDMIDREQWSTMGTDLKGQFMRDYWKRMRKTLKAVRVSILLLALIQAMVACMRPEPKKTARIREILMHAL